jgi:hypothetical protein
MKKKLFSRSLPESPNDFIRFVLIVILRYGIIAVIFVAGLSWIAHAHPPIADNQVPAFVEALRLSASTTRNPDDGHGCAK